MRISVIGVGAVGGALAALLALLAHRIPVPLSAPARIRSIDPAMLTGAGPTGAAQQPKFTGPV